MSNIKITIEGVEKEYKEMSTYPTDYKISRIHFDCKYYEEVEPVKQDYEIVSFRDIGYGKIYKFEHIHYTAYQEGYYNLEQMLSFVKKNLFTIHSVKRLSDGEVFTVGDNLGSEKCIIKIKSIEIVEFLGVVLYYNQTFSLLAHAEKVKQPTILLKTEDGKAITDRDQVLYGIDIVFTGFYKSTAKNCNNKDVKYFSTPEARDEYILYNKPVTTTLKEFYDSGLFVEKFFKSKQK